MDKHIYRGRKPGKDAYRTIKCAFCDARFKLREHAAAHERWVHSKKIERLAELAKEGNPT